MKGASERIVETVCVVEDVVEELIRERREVIGIRNLCEESERRPE